MPPTGWQGRRLARRLWNTLLASAATLGVACGGLGATPVHIGGEGAGASETRPDGSESPHVTSDDESIDAESSFVPPELAGLHDAVATGIFPVVVSDSTAFVIVGPIDEAYGSEKAEVIAEEPWVVAARPLDPGAPRFLHSLAGSRVRLLSAARSCDAVLGEPMVVNIGLAGEIEFRVGLEDEPRRVPSMDREELVAMVRETSSSYVALAAQVECADARIATTRVTSTPRVFAPMPASEREDQAYLEAFRRTQLYSELQALEEPSEDYRMRVYVNRYRLTDALEVAEIAATVPEIGCGPDPTYSMLFSLESGTVQVVDENMPSDVDLWVDVDGDGLIELVEDAREWTRSIYQLDVARRTIELLNAVSVSTSIGC